MELAFGHVLTREEAAKLGVLKAAEALAGQGPDKPMKALMPVDVPEKAKPMGAKEVVGTILSGMGPGLLSGVGNAMAGKGPEAPVHFEPQDVKDAVAQPDHFDHGGKVKKTGLAVVHEGETVVPADHNVSLHRALHHMNKGGLHRALGVPEGQPIPADKLAAAKNSTNPHVRKMAQFAETLGGFHHGK